MMQAHPDEPNWAIARTSLSVPVLLILVRFMAPSDRLLMPCFSTANVLNMFDDMNDIVSQLVLKWER